MSFLVFSTSVMWAKFNLYVIVWSSCLWSVTIQLLGWFVHRKTSVEWTSLKWVYLFWIPYDIWYTVMFRCSEVVIWMNLFLGPRVLTRMRFHYGVQVDAKQEGCCILWLHALLFLLRPWGVSNCLKPEYRINRKRRSALDAVTVQWQMF